MNSSTNLNSATAEGFQRLENVLNDQNLSRGKFHILDTDFLTLWSINYLMHHYFDFYLHYFEISKMN